MPDPDPWDYEGNRVNGNSDLRCPGCPFGDGNAGIECFYGVFQQFACQKIHRESLTYLFVLVEDRTLNPPEIPPDDGGGQHMGGPPLTLDQAIAIETCIVRTTDCNCTDKPATCRRSGEPLVVLCLTQGDDGGPCPGVH